MVHEKPIQDGWEELTRLMKIIMEEEIFLEVDLSENFKNTLKSVCRDVIGVPEKGSPHPKNNYK